MPVSVVVAAAASYAASAAASYAVSAFAVSAFTAAIIGSGVSAVVGGLLNGVLGGSKSGGGAGGGAIANTSAGFASRAEGRDQVVRSAVATRTIVYGRAMVSGPLIFANVSGPNRDRLWLTIPLAGHEIDAVETVYLNDEPLPNIGNVASGTYANAVVTYVHLGIPNETVDNDALSFNPGLWTSQHKLSGVAYLNVLMFYKQDVFPTGIPNIKVVIRGKKVYDPRTGLTAWSQNPALALNDYLTSSQGLDADAAEVDNTLLVAAANVCDEVVTLVSGTEPRYTCNGVVDTADTPRSIMEGLLSSMHGHMVWSGGTYRLHPGAYVAPNVTLTADDLAGPVRVRPRITRRELFNAVRGTFVSPESFWQPTDYPGQTNDTYAAQDGGQVIWKDMALPYTTSSATAQRIAKLTLERSRQGITVETKLKLSAVRLATLDTVMLTFPQLGWSAKEFKLLSWSFAPEGGVDVVLQEETAASYAWNSGNQTVVDPAPDTNLPNPFIVGMPGVPTITEEIYATTGSAGVKSRAVVAWAASDDAFVLGYLVEYRLSSDVTFTVLPRAAGTQLTLDDLLPGTYIFRLRAENSVGVRSAYTSEVSKELYGLTAPPANITNLTALAIAGRAKLSWDLSPDLDVRIGGRVVIRHTPLVTGAVWENGILLDDFPGDAVSADLDLLTGTYMARARDSSGNYSMAMIAAVLTESQVTGFTTVATITEAPVFAGTKTNAYVDASALRIGGSALLDGMGLIDSWGALDSLGGVASSGQYLFNGALNFGAVLSRRLNATIQALAYDAGDLIDDRSDIDSWGAVDGGQVNDVDATLYYRTTQTDPTGSPVWGPWVPFMTADVTAWGVQFRLDLTSGAPTHNIAISTLTVIARSSP